jgi:hypothetical protein
MFDRLDQFLKATHERDGALISKWADDHPLTGTELRLAQDDPEWMADILRRLGLPTHSP